jgi:asparagine synthase (glutamine-hydrolysing)
MRHEIVDLGAADLTDAFDDVSEQLSEPLADSSLLPAFLVCRAARRSMKVALGGDGADELFAGYPNFVVQRFAPAMRFVPAAFGGVFGRAIAALPGAAGYMNRRFLLGQLAHGFGAPVERQSFLWMAPAARDGLAALSRRGALPKEALSAAFAPIDRRAAEAAGSAPVDLLLYLFLTAISELAAYWCELEPI